jgi:hypothetical protein
VQRFDIVASERVARSIAELRACMAENEVYYKEHLSYREGLSGVQAILQKKVEYLLANEEKIVKYYDMLKPQLLQELYEISKKIFP